MWSSSGEEQNSSKALERVSSLSSSTSTTTSASSAASSQLPFSGFSQNSGAKTMEEVWKDINLSSLQDQPSSRDDHNTASFRSMMFQDFLARPFDKDPHQATAGTAGRFGGGLTPSPPLPPPATMLTLNSGPEFHLFGNSTPLRQSPVLQPRSISHPCSLTMQFDGLGSCPGMNVHGNGKKRCPEPENSNNNGDRRHKRMIKNRESAARSRARKQECLCLYDLAIFVPFFVFRIGIICCHSFFEKCPFVITQYGVWKCLKKLINV